MMRVVTTGADGFLGWHTKTPFDAHARAHDYNIPNTSQCAVNFLLSTWRRHATWAGLRDAGADR
jgi:hypothetical protein